MSLLSELIAQLTALIEQNRQTESEIQGARDTTEGALGIVQAVTVDSNNPLVEQGIGQWLAAMEKLDEARALMAAGNQAMTDYINGPLLGGAAGSSGGGGGNKPPSRPATPAPPPEPEPSRPSGPGEGTSQVTRPRFAPDPTRRPSGPPAKIEGKETKRRSLEKENESAQILARAGYDLEQNPPPKPNGKEPDYRVQGDYFDCYSPTGDSVRTIYGQLYKKVSEGQADRIVLNLDLTGADREDIRARLERYPIRGLREIKIIEQGVITQFYPWESEETRNVD